jgi:hypothetical protein
LGLIRSEFDTPTQEPQACVDTSCLTLARRSAERPVMAIDLEENSFGLRASPSSAIANDAAPDWTGLT